MVVDQDRLNAFLGKAVGDLGAAARSPEIEARFSMRGNLSGRGVEYWRAVRPFAAAPSMNSMRCDVLENAEHHDLRVRGLSLE
jgi:hypothetical protein